VLDALFQSPIILARRLATLDRLSDGRLVVGVGQGWMEQEFQAAVLHFAIEDVWCRVDAPNRRS
jgi:alkanesulfonate monooxygenase SsuD/methylene tetrahydromethanopterin reductase-like flavin-dependent oxidoreductase (luciferase family)